MTTATEMRGPRTEFSILKRSPEMVERKQKQASTSTQASGDTQRVTTPQTTSGNLGSGGRAVERRTVNRGDGGSIPPTADSKLRQFLSPHIACVFRKRH